MEKQEKLFETKPEPTADESPTRFPDFEDLPRIEQKLNPFSDDGHAKPDVVEMIYLKTGKESRRMIDRIGEHGLTMLDRHLDSCPQCNLLRKRSA